MKTELASGKTATLKACFKLGGFILLVGTFVPVHYILRLVGRVRPTTMPLAFHQVLVRILGFRVRLHGRLLDEEAGGPVLYVSNHSSYLDIPVLGSVIRGSFVAKSEVNGWFFIGTLARLQNTVFVERKASRASLQRDGLRERLEKGDSLVLFPEGTSSDGHRTLPFKSSLFSIVDKPLENGSFVRVQPVSIVATEVGGLPMGRAWRPYYAWYGDMTLIKHVWEVFKIGAFTVDVIFHPAVTIQDFGNRKLLAAYCQQAVASGVDQCVTGRFEKEVALEGLNLPKPPA